MRMLRIFPALLVLLLGGVANSQVPPPLPNTLQSAQSGNAAGVVQTVRGYTSIGVIIIPASSWNGVANFESSVDGANYTALYCANSTTGVYATSYSSPSAVAQFVCPVSGMLTFRARTSGASVGNVTITSLTTFSKKRRPGAGGVASLEADSLTAMALCFYDQNYCQTGD